MRLLGCLGDSITSLTVVPERGERREGGERRREGGEKKREEKREEREEGEERRGEEK